MHEESVAPMKVKIGNLTFIALVALFSMFGEYWVRGRYAFQKPIYEWAIIFVFYFAFFKMADDLVDRFRLRDYQLFIVAAIFGAVQETFNTGGALNDTAVLGINPAGIAIPLLMWGTTQTLLGFYFGRRLLGKAVEHRKMGKLPWAVIIVFNLIILIAIQFEKTSFGTQVGYTMCLLIVGLLLFLLIWSIRRQKAREPVAFKRSWFLDLVIGTYFVTGIVSGTCFTGALWAGPTEMLEFGKLTASIFGFYTIIASLILLAYRLKTKKSLPI